MIKLSDWCTKNGIKYLTGYRWFKSGQMPVNAYQTPSGTILVEDIGVGDEDVALESMETTMPSTKTNDSPVAQIIKKAVEISKSGAAVEDLATFVISNFKLSEHDVPEAPVARRARMKPTKEMTENHFKKFMKAPKEKPSAQMFLVNESDLENVVSASEKASAIDGGLKLEFNGTQNFGTLVPTSSQDVASIVAASSLQDQQSIVSVMNTAMQSLPNANLVATPKTYTSLENGAVFTRTLAGGEAVINSTLSAASAASSAVSFGALASSSEPASNYYSVSYDDSVELNDDDSLEPMNEALVYRPVTYDEARALLNLVVDSNVKNNPLALDRQAKEVCKLGRDTFEMMLLAAKANRK